MQTVIIRVRGTDKCYIRTLCGIPSPGDTIGIMVGGEPMTLRVDRAHYPQQAEGLDSTPTVYGVEIASEVPDAAQNG